jgi:hypothetical protein
MKTLRPLGPLAWTLAALALAGAALACSITPSVVESPAPLAPVQTELPDPNAAPPQSGGGAVNVVNESGTTICYLYISPTSSDEWGEDWLGSAGTISSGDSQSFEVAPGDYDLRVEDCDTSRIAEVFGVSVSSSGYSWAIPFVPVTLRMVNNSSATVCYVFISPSTSEYWGGDWLGHSETIGPGGSRDFAVPPGQNYDVMATDCNQDTLDDQRGIPISESVYTWEITGP